MTDATTLGDLPSPALGDYVLSWRGSVAYRLNVGYLARTDAGGTIVGVGDIVGGGGSTAGAFTIGVHAPGSISTGPFIEFWGSATAGAGELRFGTNGQGRWRLGTSGHLVPAGDNVYALGVGSLRTAVIFSATGTINTSDGREKSALRSLDPLELRAARTIAAGIGGFQWLAAVAEKGEAARVHVGVIAQDVIAALEAEGLDPFRYAFVCYDRWDAVAAVPAVEAKMRRGRVIRAAQPAIEGREAGDRYGIRPDQLALFLIRAQEARLAALEEAAERLSWWPRDDHV